MNWKDIDTYEVHDVVALQHILLNLVPSFSGKKTIRIYRLKEGYLSKGVMDLIKSRLILEASGTVYSFDFGADYTRILVTYYRVL